MKKSLLLSFLLISSILFSGVAFAVQVEFVTQNWFAWGRTYDVTGAPTNLNPWDNSSTKTLTPGTYVPQNPGATEDAFGVTEITQIREISTLNPIWQQTVGSDELTVFFYDAHDVQIDAAGTNLLTNGFRAKFYLDDKDNFNPALGTAGRGLAIDEYNTAAKNDLSEGQLVLELVGHQQWQDYWLDVAQTIVNPAPVQPFTLSSDGNPQTGAFNGSILLDVVGGDWMSLYDTNMFGPGLSGSMADFTLSSSTLPSGLSDWIVQGNATAQANVIPEPSTFLLFGGGILGLGFFARRKKKA